MGNKQKSIIVVVSFMVAVTGYLLYRFGPYAHAQTKTDWYMSAANPERTSYTPEQIDGQLSPEWYRIIDPHIPNKAQIIAVQGIIYVPTAKGLYAFDSTTGALKWIFPTKLPLGNSPTVVNGVAYFGAFDRKLYAIDANPDTATLPTATDTRGNQVKVNTKLFWTFEGGAGFDTNPLVINQRVYAGNRDGTMYALYAHDYADQALRGKLAWQFKTGGPIHFSATYKNNTVYFAANDAYAYALRADSGALVWKSEKLPAADGFHSWWGAISGNVIIFPSSRGIRTLQMPGPPGSTGEDFYKGDHGLWPEGTALGTPLGTMTGRNMNASRAFNYLESNPSRRSYHLINLTDGKEVTYDFNGNGKPEYAPLMNTGTTSGNRSPAAVAPDGTIYTFNNYQLEWSQIAGWKLGTNYLTIPTSSVDAIDEPQSYSIGGNRVYFNKCCDRKAGSFDRLGNGESAINYYNEGQELATVAPGYDAHSTGTHESNAVKVFGDVNGEYGYHGDQNAPVPYSGRLYFHRSNAILAFSASGGRKLLTRIGSIEATTPQSSVDVNALKTKLTAEIQKMLDAGPHLRPGYGQMGLNGYALGQVRGDKMADYWHSTADTLYALTLAYPHLDTTMQTKVKSYLALELQNYSPLTYDHNGWKQGAPREDFILPQTDVVQYMTSLPNNYRNYNFEGWGNGESSDENRPPFTFYELWKYAQTFGGAKEIYDGLINGGHVGSAPNNAYLAENPPVHNAWIAGYYGLLGLQKIAYPTQTENTTHRNELNRLLALRASAFLKDQPWGGDSHDAGRSIASSRNFIYMTPELGSYLRQNALTKIEAARKNYIENIPYWFVSRFEETFGESLMQSPYDYWSLFQTERQIFNLNREELYQYLDVPSVPRGDLYYIQNLVTVIEAPTSGIAPQATNTPWPVTVTTAPVHCQPLGNIDCTGKVSALDLSYLLSKLGTTEVTANLDDTGKVNVIDLTMLLGNYGK
ncbi:MAG: PQQ-binding-like beta-propeller repeat protein [Patescibacteria group bacterium]|jgi:hypothetical protein